MFKRLKEAVGIGTPDNYASKAMNLLGNAFLLDRAKAGLNDEFWWDQEDRTPLKGEEVYEPRLQRLYCATDDFRRWFTFGVARILKYFIVGISTLIILVGFAVLKVGGDAKDGSGQEQSATQESVDEFYGQGPQQMTDKELIAAKKKMEAAGKNQNTLTDNERAILNEMQRRGIY